MSFIKLKSILFRWGEESFSSLQVGFSNAVGRSNVNLYASFINSILKTVTACENVSCWTPGQMQSVQHMGLIWNFVRYRTYFRNHRRKFLEWFLWILLEMHLRLWRKPAGVTRLLFIIFERSWQSGEIPDDWKNTNVAPILKRSNTYSVVGLSTAPGKIMEQILLESVSEHMKGKKVTENS